MDEIVKKFLTYSDHLPKKKEKKEHKNLKKQKVHNVFIKTK